MSSRAAGGSVYAEQIEEPNFEKDIQLIEGCCMAGAWLAQRLPQERPQEERAA